MQPESGEEPERFFFVHMQKTGGISLYMRLQREFGERGVYPDSRDGDPVEVSPQIMLPVLLERWAARRQEIRVVTGHFPLCTTELLDADFRTFTILRDPVERTLSYLRHHRATTPADSERSLEEIYGERLNFRHFIENHMVKMLSMTSAEMRPTAVMTMVDFDRKRLETAKHALEGLDAFGFQEDLEGFVRALEQRFDWDLGPPVRENTTGQTEAGDSFRRRIARDNVLDVELYEHARGLLEAGS